MIGDLAIALMAAGATLIAAGGSCALIRWMRRRPWADVLDMIEPPRTGSGVKPPAIVMPLRCICTGRRSYCDCAIDGVRNPRGAGRARSYCCGTCGSDDRTKFVRCNHPLCPDGRDQVAR